jgi:hypothetical protein
MANVPQLMFEDHRRDPAERDRSCGYRIEEIEDPLIEGPLSGQAGG